MTKWANESHKAAVDHAYNGVPEPTPGAPPFLLTETYVKQAQPVVDEQIMKAGVRLAKLLNDALDH